MLFCLGNVVFNKYVCTAYSLIHSLDDCVFAVAVYNCHTAELETADDYEDNAAGKQADVNCEQQLDAVEQVRYRILVK